MSEPERILPSMRVDGQVAVVTGAGKGIGRGCALALAEAGADVVAMARTESDLVQLVDTIEAAGGTARAVVVDVTDTIEPPPASAIRRAHAVAHTNAPTRLTSSTVRKSSTD